MRKKQLIILIILIGVLGGIALFLGQERTKEQEGVPNTPLLFPKLKDKLAEVTTLKVFKKRGIAYATLVKSKNHWIVQEKHHYPADTTKINRLLFALSEAHILEAKTSHLENYAKLGIASLEGEKELDKGAQLEVFGQNGIVLASLLVGEYRFGANGGTIVRKPNEEQSWLVSGELTVPSEVTGWLDKKLIHVRPDSVHKVTLTPAKGKALTVFKDKPDQSNFVISGLSKKLKPPKNGELDVLASGLSHLYLDDVLLDTDVDWKHQSVTQVEYRLFDGLVVQGKLAKIKDKNVFVLQTFVEQPILKENKDEKTKSKSETDKQITALNMEQFKQRLESYAYVIPDYQADLMRKRLEDFIDKTPKETPQTKKKKSPPNHSPEIKEEPGIETALSK